MYNDPLLRMSPKLNSTSFLIVFGLGVFLLGMLFINTCKRIYLDPNEFTEGRVIYQITYPELDSAHLFMPFLPHKMIMQVKGKKLKNETKSGLGLFQTGMIANLTKKSAISYMKLINVRYKTSFDEQYFELVNEATNIDPVVIDSSTTDFGEPIKRALVKYPWSETQDTIRFTAATYSPNLNFNIGFGMVDGILLEYEQRLEGVVLHFKAVSIERESVPKSEFKLDPDYRELNRLDFMKEMSKTLSPLRD